MERPVFILHRIDTVINITRLVTIHYFEFAKDFVFDGESHDIWEMVYVDKGEILETAGTQTIVLRQGELLFHKPGEFHSLRANGKDCSNVFVITFVSSSRMMSFFERKHCRLKAEHRRLIGSIIEEGRLAFELPFFDVHMTELKEKKEAPVGAQQLIRLYLEQLLILLIREQTAGDARYRFLPTKEDVDDQVVSEIISLLEENLDGDIKIEQVCRRLHYGKTYVSQIFKKKTGYTIRQYYTRLKIEEAKKIMRETECSVTEVAIRLNFESSQYFSRVFQKITNMTPTEYKRSVMAC